MTPHRVRMIPGYGEVGTDAAGHRLRAWIGRCKPFDSRRFQRSFTTSEPGRTERGAAILRVR